MKLSLLQHTRRTGIFRGSSPLDSSADGSVRSSATMFWLVLHGLCCLISLILGFRFSRLVFIFIFTASSSYTAPFGTSSDFHHSLSLQSSFSDQQLPLDRSMVSTTPSATSRVVVGRHGIRIRPWPHPHPVEVMKAHRIIHRVQREQRVQFGLKDPRRVIAVTTTYVRTFQTLHLTGVMHSLMLLPYDVVWIVVEAGGPTNETGQILAKSGLSTIHVGFHQSMPNSWEERQKLEIRMRVRALRILRADKLDGIVVFADDSNVHSMELFDEIQNVKWIGAVSVGILAHPSSASGLPMAQEDDGERPSIPIQGPDCDSSDELVGWHTFDSALYEGKTAVYIGDKGVVLPRKWEWSGFVLNSRLLWEEADDKPEWVKDLDSVDEAIESPLSLLRDPSVVEPLGSCGRQVMIWWLRVEARPDSNFPPGWAIDPPLKISVPSKRTPWSDVPPEVPSEEKMPANQDHMAKTRSSTSKHSSRKRKQDAMLADAQISAWHSEQN